MLILIRWLQQKPADLDLQCFQTVTYIRVTGNFNEILILNPSSFVGHITQVLKLGEINIIYLHDSHLLRFWNTQCHFSFLYLN